MKRNTFRANLKCKRTRDIIVGPIKVDLKYKAIGTSHDFKIGTIVDLLLISSRIKAHHTKIIRVKGATSSLKIFVHSSNINSKEVLKDTWIPKGDMEILITIQEIKEIHISPTNKEILVLPITTCKEPMEILKISRIRTINGVTIR